MLAFTKWRKYRALNYLLLACEMLRARVTFNEVCPPQITSGLQAKLNTSVFVEAEGSRKKRSPRLSLRHLPLWSSRSLTVDSRLTGRFSVWRMFASSLHVSWGLDYSLGFSVGLCECDATRWDAGSAGLATLSNTLITRLKKAEMSFLNFYLWLNYWIS